VNVTNEKEEKSQFGHFFLPLFLFATQVELTERDLMEVTRGINITLVTQQKAGRRRGKQNGDRRDKTGTGEAKEQLTIK
jgi:hypothetical protein